MWFYSWSANGLSGFLGLMFFRTDFHRVCCCNPPVNACKAPSSCLQESTNRHHKEFSIAGDFLCPFSVKASFQNIVVCMGQKYFSQGSVFFLISKVLFDLMPASHMVQRSGRKLHRAVTGRCSVLAMACRQLVPFTPTWPSGGAAWFAEM